MTYFIVHISRLETEERNGYDINQCWESMQKDKSHK